jgi:hypothetical protein
MNREDRIRGNYQARGAGAFMDDEFDDDQDGMMDIQMRKERLRMMQD